MNPHACSPSCTSGWGPTKRCHCTGCGEDFSTPANFDQHRTKPQGRCHNPQRRGLVQDLRGVWHLPDTTITEEDSDV